MGSAPSVPNLKFDFTSSCCNGGGSKEDLVRPRSSSRIWRAVQASKSKWQNTKASTQMAERSNSVYFESSGEVKV